MRFLIPVLLILFSSASVAETIVCTKDFTLSSVAGVKKGNNGNDRYHYEPGILREVLDGRTLWGYSIVSEKDDLIVGALRQKEHLTDMQVVVIDRKNKSLSKTVIQGNLRFTTFGPCAFAR